jgi:hypothetical protein
VGFRFHSGGLAVVIPPNDAPAHDQLQAAHFAQQEWPLDGHFDDAAWGQQLIRFKKHTTATDVQRFAAAYTNYSITA